MKVYRVIEGRLHVTEIQARHWLAWARAGWAGCRRFALRDGERASA